MLAILSSFSSTSNSSFTVNQHRYYYWLMIAQPLCSMNVFRRTGYGIQRCCPIPSCESFTLSPYAGKASVGLYMFLPFWAHGACALESLSSRAAWEHLRLLLAKPVDFLSAPCTHEWDKIIKTLRLFCTFQMLLARIDQGHFRGVCDAQKNVFTFLHLLLFQWLCMRKKIFRSVCVTWWTIVFSFSGLHTHTHTHVSTVWSRTITATNTITHGASGTPGWMLPSHPASGNCSGPSHPQSENHLLGFAPNSSHTQNIAILVRLVMY